MATTIGKLQVWRAEVENRPGALDAILEPLANAGADLSVVFGWVDPANPNRGVVEVGPIKGRKQTDAAKSVGLVQSDVPVLVVQGPNAPGLGHRIANAVAQAGINLKFLAAQVAGRNYSAVFGFESASDATKAQRVIKNALTARGGAKRAGAKKKRAAKAKK